MDIWEKNKIIYIQVNRHFVYDIKCKRIGEPNDPAGSWSMWGWINHLRDKTWWHDELEKSFIRLCEKIIEE